MLTDETATLDEVATAIGRSAAWLKRHWLRLHLSHAFPRKIAGGGFVWPRRAVEAWLRAGGAQPQALLPANENRPETDPIAAHAAALDRRHGVTA